MSTASSSNSSGEEANKKSGSNNEESSHLLESAENGAKYGSRQPVKIVKASDNGRTSSTPHVRKDSHVFIDKSTEKNKTYISLKFCKLWVVETYV